MISDDSDTAKYFSEYFKDAVNNLNLRYDENLLTDTSNITDPLDIAIKKIENHPSIIAIRNNFELPLEFNFKKMK